MDNEQWQSGLLKEMEATNRLLVMIFMELYRQGQESETGDAVISGERVKDWATQTDKFLAFLAKLTT